MVFSSFCGHPHMRQHTKTIVATNSGGRQAGPGAECGLLVCPVGLGGGGLGRTYEVLEDALVERALPAAALPELLVVVVEALPVLAELLEAGFVDVFEAVSAHMRVISKDLGLVVDGTPRRFAEYEGEVWVVGMRRPCHNHTIPRPSPSLSLSPVHPKPPDPGIESTYTDAAHRVTFRPSLKHSTSPLPLLSVLHSM